MTRLTQLPPHWADEINTAAFDASDALEERLTPHTMRGCALSICNALLKSGKARIVTGGRGRQGEDDLIINMGVENRHDT